MVQRGHATTHSSRLARSDLGVIFASCLSRTCFLRIHQKRFHSTENHQPDLPEDMRDWPSLSTFSRLARRVKLPQSGRLRTNSKTLMSARAIQWHGRGPDHRSAADCGGSRNLCGDQDMDNAQEIDLLMPTMTAAGSPTYMAIFRTIRDAPTWTISDSVCACSIRGSVRIMGDIPALTSSRNAGFSR